MRSNVVDEQSEARKLMLAQMEQKQPERWASGKMAYSTIILHGERIVYPMHCFG